MKKFKKLEYLPVLAAVLGAAAMGLHELMYALALDEKHLMAANHPLEGVIFALTAAVFALAAAAVYPLDGVKTYEVNFPADPMAAAGNFVMAAGAVLTVLLWQPGMGGVIGQIWTVCGIAAGLCLVWTGICRRKGKKPGFFTHTLICLFLVTHVVSHYQSWSRVAVLQDYFFPLLGSLSLMLFAYYHIAFDVDLGKRRIMLALGLISVYLCTAALSHSGYPLLYAGGAVWAGTNLCAWQVPPEPKKEEKSPMPGEGEA